MGPPPRWPGTRCRWPSRPRRGWRPAPGRWPPPGGWMPRTPPCGQVLAWAMEHDAALALRLAVALAPWWFLRGRLAGQYPLLREAAGRAAPGSDGWCAAQYLARPDGSRLGRSGRGAGPLHRGPRRHRGPGAVPGAGGLPGRPVGDIGEPGPDSRGGPRTAAAAWPWPGSSATRPGRRWPWRTSASPPLRRRPRQRACGWPGRPSRSRPTSPAG